LEAEKDDLLREKIRKIRASPEMSISPFLLLPNIRASSAAIAVSTKFPGLSSSKSAEEEEEEGRAARVPACYY
jgi:hypothetical protein